MRCWQDKNSLVLIARWVSASVIKAEHHAAPTPKKRLENSMRSPRQLRRKTLPELGHQKKTEKKQRFKKNRKVFLSDPPSSHKPPLILRTRGTVSSHSPTFGLGAPCDRPKPCPTSVRRAGSGFYPGQALALGLSKAVPRGNKYDVQPAPRSSWRGVTAESPTPWWNQHLCGRDPMVFRHR